MTARMTPARVMLLTSALAALTALSAAPAWGQAESAETAPAAAALPEPATEATAPETAAPETTAPEAAVDPAAAETAQGIGRVARAAFATAIEAREPVDSIDSLSNDHSRVFFFTELVDLQGQSVVHRWEHDGQVVAEVPFEVGGPRWRVYSTKSLLPGSTGEWTATVVDGQGNVLTSQRLRYVAAAEPEPPAAPDSGAP